MDRLAYPHGDEGGWIQPKICKAVRIKPSHFALTHGLTDPHHRVLLALILIRDPLYETGSKAAGRCHIGRFGCIGFMQHTKPKPTF